MINFWKKYDLSMSCWCDKHETHQAYRYFEKKMYFRSKIQGLGLYAARDLEKHTMVIEYIGEIIRTELAETREKKYEAKVCFLEPEKRM